MLRAGLVVQQQRDTWSAIWRVAAVRIMTGCLCHPLRGIKWRLQNYSLPKPDKGRALVFPLICCLSDTLHISDQQPFFICFLSDFFPLCWSYLHPHIHEFFVPFSSLYNLILHSSSPKKDDFFYIHFSVWMGDRHRCTEISQWSKALPCEESDLLHLDCPFILLYENQIKITLLFFFFVP